MTSFSLPRPSRLAGAAGLTLALAAVAGCGAASGAAGSPSSAATQTAAAAPSAASTSTLAGSGGARVTGTAPAGSQQPVPVESNPPGDIPDNIAFVRYTNPVANYSFTHPEGWAEQESGAQVTFTDKLNGITAGPASPPVALSVDAVKQQEVPRLSGVEPAFELRSVQPVTLPAGPAIEVTYRRNSAPDPVTGKQVRDEVQEYLVGTGNAQLRLDLYGPVGADNVDAYRTVTTSLRLR